MSKGKGHKASWDLIASDLNRYKDDLNKAIHDKEYLSKDLVNKKLLLEQSQLKASHHAKTFNIRKVEVEELKRKRDVVEEERSSLDEKVSSSMRV